MKKYALARSENGHPRFFTGRYVAGASLAFMSPVTSRQPKEAKIYDDESVARVVVAFLNLAVEDGGSSQPWIVMPMQEAWI